MSKPKPGAEKVANEALPADPGAPGALDALREILKSPRALSVARAARMIKEHRVEGLHKELVEAYARFAQDPIKRDPGCHAKLALLEALDFTEHDELEPFLRAAHHVQREKAWGPPTDTASGVRARAIVALARLQFEDLGLLAAELLLDPEAPVRLGASEALVLSGAPSHAALLLLKLSSGDTEPMVTLACMSGLLSLSPAWGMKTLQKHLRGADEVLREMAALSLGESRRDDALTLLLSTLEDMVLARERVIILRALGLHRSERALGVLLEVIADGGAPDAKAAIEALGARRFETGLTEKVYAAAKQNTKVALSPVLDEFFPSE